jgi:single stranded DNA-binding protein
MSFNKITIVGYLGRDPELRYTPQGTAVCNMSIATTEKRRDASGETEEHTIWFRVTAWGRQAELAAEYLAKGRQVYVEGRLRREEYTDREGVQRGSLEVNASDIQFLGWGSAPNLRRGPRRMARSMKRRRTRRCRSLPRPGMVKGRPRSALRRKRLLALRMTRSRFDKDETSSVSVVEGDRAHGLPSTPQFPSGQIHRTQIGFCCS